MARHEIMIHENTSVTKESAPYLGSYISKETLKTDEFAAKIAEKCGLPAIHVQAIITGAYSDESPQRHAASARQVGWGGNAPTDFD